MLRNETASASELAIADFKKFLLDNNIHNEVANNSVRFLDFLSTPCEHEHNVGNVNKYVSNYVNIRLQDFTLRQLLALAVFLESWNNLFASEDLSVNAHYKDFSREAIFPEQAAFGYNYSYSYIHGIFCTFYSLWRLDTEEGRDNLVVFISALSELSVLASVESSKEYKVDIFTPLSVTEQEFNDEYLPQVFDFISQLSSVKDVNTNVVSLHLNIAFREQKQSRDFDELTDFSQHYRPKIPLSRVYKKLIKILDEN